MLKILSVLFLVLFGGNVKAAGHVELEGHIVDESQRPLAKSIVSVQGRQTATDRHGYFQLSLDPAAVYKITIKRQGFYSTIHTHSHYELANQADDKLLIAPIELVSKVKGRTLMAFGGDVMMGRRYAKPYFNNPVLIHTGQETSDTKAIVEHIKPYMELADFAAVNLETQLAEHAPAERAPKSVTFFSPPQTLAALEYAGIDYVTLGNNHTYDYLDSGLKSSLAYLNNSNLGYSGAGINQEQALAPYRTILQGTKYSMFGFVGWEGNFSPNQTASANKGGAAYGSIDNITKPVARESALNRATIVQYHGSQEYAPEPTLVTEQRLKAAIDSGADLAIAHHPHVTQGFEIYRNKLIAYSMGNFIFDQFFYSTPHSMILYVWMDGQNFHRAEIVPVYLKGYKPTPSTGANRFTVLRRLTALSKKRGVTITRSGGHGVIRANASAALSPTAVDFRPRGKGKIHSLPMAQWQQPISSIEAEDQSLQYRLGVNLVNASDFESYALFNANERGWNIDQNGFSHSKQQAFSGQHSLTTILKPKTNELLAMTNFRRVYRGGHPMSVILKVKAERDTTLNISWQGRKSRKKFFDALTNGQHHLIDSIEIKGSPQWQDVEVTFNSPRIGYRSLRMMAQFNNSGSVDSRVFVDDFALIEWQSAFRQVTSPSAETHLSSQASYIEFKRALKQDETISLNY